MDMEKTSPIYLERVSSADIIDFQKMVEEYWQELMPHTLVVKDQERRKVYFQESFTWSGGNRHPHWAMVDGRRVGFISFEVSSVNNSATVANFYVFPNERRKGYGSALMQALYEQLDKLDVELIELNVRRDNPGALMFWEAQGFRIALHCLRQYRDPQTGTAFIGGLSSDFAVDP
jgi:ribosomal protein S18 acetylase RimI-like enzyme